MVMVVVETIAAYSGGLAAQVSWPVPKVSCHLVLFCIHQMTRANSCIIWVHATIFLAGQ